MHVEYRTLGVRQPSRRETEKRETRAFVAAKGVSFKDKSTRNLSFLIFEEHKLLLGVGSYRRGNTL